MPADGSKIAFFKVLDFMFLSQDASEISEKVLDKDFSRLGVSEVHTVGVHGGKESGTRVVIRDREGLVSLKEQQLVVSLHDV